MADRIFTYDVQQGIQMAWHGKTQVSKTLSLEDNWLTTWEPVPVFLEKRRTPSRWAILECSDVPEVEIGQPYNPNTFTPINNAAFLGMIKQSLAGTPHKLVSVGSLRNRGRVFVSIELIGMEKFKAAGRNFSAYLNFGNGHDKSSVLWINTSNVCTVCDNTFTCNLVSVENKASTVQDDNLKITQRHTKNVLLRLPQIADIIDKAVGVQAEFQLELDKLHKVECQKPEARQIFAGFIGRDIPKAKRNEGLSTRSFNTAERLTELFSDRIQGNQGETLADAFSAVTDYYTHHSSGGENVFRQVQSSEYGAGATAKHEFWNVVRDFERRTATRELGEELLANTKK